MAVGYCSRFGFVRCLRCPNRYARKIVLAKIRKPKGMATPIPILLEVGCREKSAKKPALGPELVFGDSVVVEDFAAGSECTDLVPLELFAVAGLTAMLES